MHGTLKRDWYSMTPEQRLAAYRQAEAGGLTATQFCALFNAGDTPRKWLAKRGLRFSTKGSTGGIRKLTAENAPRVEEIRRLCSSLSARDIGSQLGITRNAVIGLAWRNGIELRRPNPRKAKQARKQAAPRRVYADAPAPRALSLDELTLRTCRFPIGDPRAEPFGFCGHECPVERPYCEHHMAVAYRPGTALDRPHKALEAA